MGIRTDEFKAMPVGTKTTFKAKHPRDLQNIRATASYVHNTYPEIGKRFKTHLNRPKLEITIEVVSTSKKK